MQVIFLNLVSKAVNHKSLGAGRIVAQTATIVTVQFGEKQMKFSFPSIFREIMTMEDATLQREISELCETESYAINRQKEELLLSYENRFAPVVNAAAQKAKRVKKYHDNENIAIKCNYCDGGRNIDTFGYKGICSEEVLRENVTLIKRPWCSAGDCECKKYTLGEFDRAELERKDADGKFVCYESRLLRDWVASVGRHQSEKSEKPVEMNKARVNRLCVLTTKEASELELERKIFAAFIISEVEVGDEKAEGNVHAHPKFRIELSPAEAQHVHFWDYHKNKSKMDMPFWGSGLLRYITDAQSINILKGMMEATQSPEKKAQIMEALEYYCRVTAAASAK